MAVVVGLGDGGGDDAPAQVFVINPRMPPITCPLINSRGQVPRSLGYTFPSSLQPTTASVRARPCVLAAMLPLRLLRIAQTPLEGIS